GCGEAIDPEFFIPLRYYKSIAEELWQRLKNHVPRDRSADGLLQTAPLVGRKKTLIFLVSDFHCPFALLFRLLQDLDRHDVVPIVLWDSREMQFPKRGILRLQDPESGRSRVLLMRPDLKQRIDAAFERRRNLLIKLCTEFGREPFFVTNGFNPDDLTHYFLN
ncbi:MAG: DUF58 domain-containing protein, partial [Gammaproteobacteria bacterium]